MSTQADQDRAARLFIQGLATAAGLDQANPSDDGRATNPSGQYQVISPAGVAVEGKPITIGQTGAAPSGLLLWAGLGLLVYLALKA